MWQRAILPICALLLAVPARALTTDAHRDVLIDDPQALRALDAMALDLGSVVFGTAARSAAELASQPAWAGLIAHLRADLAAKQKRDAKAGVGLRYGHRLFDVRWLQARQARFELIGVVNRMDRARQREEGCGETRLIYRLAYERGDDASRLPMTVNVVFRQPGTCAEAWRRWPWHAQTQPQLLRAAGGALHPDQLTPPQLIAVEVNLQVERWPSTLQPDLGGHAAYLLRVFQRDAQGAFQPAPLEAQPDVPRLRADAPLRARLFAWLVEPAHIAEIDAGIARLPTEFLARSAESVAPRGLARLANRPFRQLFSPQELAQVDLHAYAQMRTPELYLRRLDTLSCTGCHQSSSLAGFHLLGQEATARRTDALAVGRSPHLQHEIAQRQADMDRWPEMPPLRRPDSPDLLDAGMPNGPCGLHDSGIPACLDLPTAQLRCVQVDDPEAGVCLPSAGEIGGVCEAGELLPGATPQRDRLRARTALACPPGGFCDSSRAGFPAGMCGASCANPPDGTTCAAIPQLTPFNACLARKRPFVTCVVESAVPVLVRGCSEESPCRPDYVCSRGPQGQGACMPPYFLRQLRVDGHMPVR